MAFLITLTENSKFEESGELCVWGEIVIGDFRERFHAPVEVWSVNDYKNHWMAVVDQLAANPRENKLALIVSMRNPRISVIITCWTLYPMGETIFIQNHIVFCEGKESLIEEGIYHKLVHDRETESEDGAKISEWKISREDVLEFGRFLKTSRC